MLANLKSGLGSVAVLVVGFEQLWAQWTMDLSIGGIGLGRYE